ncbi:unnamed protein product, partial [marine sediment metagenome]
AAALEEAGEAGFFKALGKLKGELPKPKFEPVKDLLKQVEVDDLFNYIKQAPLDFYNKISAATGLSKVLGGGGIPTNSELKLLRDIFGKELVETILKKRPWQKRLAENITEVLNLPRTLMTAFDMSAWLRQGGMLTAAKPKQALPNVWKMVKSFGSDKFFKEAMNEITERPTYPLMKQSGLSLTEISGDTIGFAAREEGFLSNFAQKIPIVGKLVKASERAYVGFLNLLRADVYDDVAGEFRKGGFTPEANPKVFKDLAKFINNATG